MSLPTQFTNNIQDIFGESGKIWLKQLPQALTEISTDWQLSLKPHVSNLTYSYVAPAITAFNGEELILKISPPNQRTNQEITWYETNLTGAAKLINSDKNRGAILLQHLKPGHTAKKLVQEGNDDKATYAITEVINSLKHTPPNTAALPHVSDLAKSLIHLQDKIDPKLLARAQEIFKTYTADSSKDVILHGDLHHDNILLHNNKWIAIDPHGYIGPKAFEVGAMIRNPYDCFPKHVPLNKLIGRRLEILTAELPFSKEEIVDWSFAYTLLAASWSAKDHNEVPKAHVETAKLLIR